MKSHESLFSQLPFNIALSDFHVFTIQNFLFFLSRGKLKKRRNYFSRGQNIVDKRVRGYASMKHEQKSLCWTCFCYFFLSLHKHSHSINLPKLLLSTIIVLPYLLQYSFYFCIVREMQLRRWNFLYFSSFWSHENSQHSLKIE